MGKDTLERLFVFSERRHFGINILVPTRIEPGTSGMIDQSAMSRSRSYIIKN